MSLGKPYRWWPGINPRAQGLWRDNLFCMPFWEGHGDTCFDLSSYANHGILTSMDPPTDWIGTPFGHGLRFDGDEHVLSSVGNHTEISVHLVFSPSTTGSADALFNYGSNDGEPSLLIQNNSGTLRILPWNSGYQNLTSISAGEWYTLTLATKENTSEEAWLNGIKVRDAGSSASNNPSTDTVHIGAGYGGDFEGDIVFAAMWNRLLTDAEAMLLAADPFCMVRPRTFAPHWAGIGVGFVPFPYPRGLRGGHSVMTGGLI